MESGVTTILYSVTDPAKAKALFSALLGADPIADQPYYTAPCPHHRQRARPRAAHLVRDAKDGQVVCFFQSAQKFNTRYAALGFSDKAHLDDGAMWPVAFALTEWTAAAEARIGALVQQATGRDSAAPPGRGRQSLAQHHASQAF